MARRTDSRKKPRRPINGQTLREALEWVMQERIFSHLSLHGNTTWKVIDLILLASVWVWSAQSTLTGAFTEAHRFSIQVLGRAALDSFQGLLKALVRWTPILLPLIWQRQHQLMQKHGGKHWRVGRWLALAVDGSRVSVPRSQDKERTFCAPHFGQSRTAKYRRKIRRAKGIRRRRSNKPIQPIKPQIWLTLLWHMGLHLPWSWKSGPSYSNEREHFRTLLEEQQFPENTLFCGDAGFVGYDLWTTILNAKHSFLIRVGSNVHLLRSLGYHREHRGIVYFWPNKVAQQKQPPLVLRLFALQVGRRKMWLVSNVLEEQSLSHREARDLYRLRWGVELQFRTLKQTFGRGKLRSRTPDRA
jgi:hypothetical protein